MASDDIIVTNPRFFDRVWKVSAFRTGPTKGFVGEHPEWFNPQPNLLEIEKLRIAFKIEKHLKSTDPNTCELIVTNANPSTRSLLCSKPLVVRIDAGHKQDVGARHLFTGDLRHGYSKRDGTNWQTVLDLGDGASMFNGARANKSFVSGTPVIQILRYVASTMGVELPAEVLANTSLQRSFSAGYSAYGVSSRQMDQLLAPYGYGWSIQDGRLVVLRDEQAAPGTALLISPRTGLIGSPQYKTPSKGETKKGKPAELTFQILLYPQITPGFLLSVQTEAINGIFRAERVTHSGDTHSTSDWTTEVEAKPVSEASEASAA